MPAGKTKKRIITASLGIRPFTFTPETLRKIRECDIVILAALPFSTREYAYFRTFCKKTKLANDLPPGKLTEPAAELPDKYDTVGIATYGHPAFYYDMGRRIFEKSGKANIAMTVLYGVYSPANILSFVSAEGLTKTPFNLPDFHVRSVDLICAGGIPVSPRIPVFVFCLDHPFDAQFGLKTGDFVKAFKNYPASHQLHFVEINQKGNGRDVHVSMSAAGLPERIKSIPRLATMFVPPV